MLAYQGLNQDLPEYNSNLSLKDRLLSNTTDAVNDNTKARIDNIVDLESRKTKQRKAFNVPDRYTHLYSGKVRETYQHPDFKNVLIIIATDRISTHDVIHKSEIPGKWETLTQISNYWMEVFAKDDRTSHIPTQQTYITDWPEDFPEELKTRSIMVKKAIPMPTESIVRGHLYGSAHNWYNSETGCLETWEFIWKWLKKCSKLSEPMFTPSTKSNEKDVNINFDDMPYEIWKWLEEIWRKELDPIELANQVKEYSLLLFEVAREKAKEKWYTLADTKFEFGLDAQWKLMLIDETCTPDSSRFWVTISVIEDKEPESWDKQPVREEVVAYWKKNPDKNGKYYREEWFEKYSITLSDWTRYETSERYGGMKVVFS